MKICYRIEREDLENVKEAINILTEKICYRIERDGWEHSDNSQSG